MNRLPSRHLITGALALCLVVIVVGGAGWFWFNPGIHLSPDDPAVVSQGERLYGQYCASCHGVDLAGEPDWHIRKPNGRLPAPPHDESGHTWHHPDEQLFQLTKYGIGAAVGLDDYESDMPAYQNLLSDAEIIAVLSYIKSTWPEEVRRRHDSLNQQAAH